MTDDRRAVRLLRRPRDRTPLWWGLNTAAAAFAGVVALYLGVWWWLVVAITVPALIYRGTNWFLLVRENRS